MLTSLFGDLGAAKNPDRLKAATDGAPGAGFAATAIMETVAAEVNARGQIVDRHSQDLVVTGSPAQAIREHFAATRSDLDTATSLITLLDPAGVWAAAVIKALSDAGGTPIERLHLREHATLRTLATIERTTLVRRHEGTLRIYHADVRAPGSDNAEIPVALMERSQMTAVIIGPLQPHAIDALLTTLHVASMLPTWRCPNLLFMLPPNAVWIANKISAVAWPGRLHVHALSESMTGASSVWNAMLGMWNQMKAQPGWEPAAKPAAGVGAASAAPVGRHDAAPDRADDPAPAERNAPGVLDPARAQQALATMLALDGLLACALVDAASGLIVARESRDDRPLDIDIDLAAATCAQVLRVQREAARNMGLAEPIDESITSAGSRQQIVRTLARHPSLFLVALLDRQRTNLALTRFQLADVERVLG